MRRALVATAQVYRVGQHMFGDVGFKAHLGKRPDVVKF